MCTIQGRTGSLVLSYRRLCENPCTNYRVNAKTFASAWIIFYSQVFLITHPFLGKASYFAFILFVFEIKETVFLDIKGNVSRSFIFSKASITGSLFNHLLNLFRFREHIRHESSIPFSSIRRGIQFAESVSNIFSEKSEYVELFNEERNMLSRNQLIQWMYQVCYRF